VGLTVVDVQWGAISASSSVGNRVISGGFLELGDIDLGGFVHCDRCPD